MKWSSASFDSLSLPWGVTAEQGTRAATAGDRRLVEVAELARYTPHWERVGAPEAGAELKPGSSGPVPATRAPCAAQQQGCLLLSTWQRPCQSLQAVRCCLASHGSTRPRRPHHSLGPGAGGLGLSGSPCWNTQHHSSECGCSLWERGVPSGPPGCPDRSVTHQTALCKLLHSTVFAMMSMEGVTLLGKQRDSVLNLRRPFPHIQAWVCRRLV